MNIKHWITTGRAYALAHKLQATIIALVVLGAGWWVYGKVFPTVTQVHYVLGTVAKDTIVSSVSASGQVSALNQVDIKAKSAGDITWLGMTSGMSVYAGQALATIDATSAKQAVTNAELDLESAKLTLQKNTSQAPIDFQNTKDAVTKAEQALADANDTMYSTISDAYTTLPAVMNSANSLLHDYNINTNIQNAGAYQNIFISSDDATQGTIRTFATKAENDYTSARSAYVASYNAFKALSRTSPPADIQQALIDAQATTKLISQALASDANLIDTSVDMLNQLNRSVSSAITNQQTIAHTQLSSANSILSKVSAQVSAVQTAQQSLKTAQQAFTLASIGNPDGATPLDLELEKNDVAKKQAALADAQQALADHTVRAPFAGVLATVTAQPFDTVSAGTALATIITNRQLAQLSLNEVDVAKLKVGDKATLTFDAIEGLSLTGSVADINTIGTVSQGVVSYTIKIAFDTQDARVKPGMTVNAAIITSVHQDVLTVPASAVKQVNGTAYVQVFTPPLTDTGGTAGVVSAVAPQQVPVEVGISDDTNTEILSGLTEGEQVVTRTITGTTATAVSTAPSIFGAVGGGARAGASTGTTRNATFVR
jgi:RND family efflux transporter MFP subunit